MASLSYQLVADPVSSMDRRPISDVCLHFAKAKCWHSLIASLVAFLLPLEGCALAAAFVVVSIRQCGPSQRHKHARPAFLNQCQPSYLGGEAKYHIFKTVMLCLSTWLLSPKVISCGFTSLLKYSADFSLPSLTILNSFSKMCVGKMERFCCFA